MIISSFHDGLIWNLTLVLRLKLQIYCNFKTILILVSGLAKIEGEVIDLDSKEDEIQQPTKYQLTGIVVHSGQASGGHYYSYILHK